MDSFDNIIRSRFDCAILVNLHSDYYLIKYPGRFADDTK